MFKQKNISEYIDTIYNGTGTITKAGVIGAARKTLRQTEYTFSSEELATLLPFVMKEVKMIPTSNGEYKMQFSGRSLAGVRKDLIQFLTKGMFGDMAEQRAKAVSAKYGEDKEKYGGKYAWIDLMSEDESLRDVANEYYKVVRSLGEVQEIDEGKRYSIEFEAEKDFEIEFSKNDNAKFLVVSLLNHFNKQLEGENIENKQTIALLSTILTLRKIVPQDQSIDKVLKELAYPLAESISNPDEKNAIVRKKAVELSTKRLQQLNANGGKYDANVGSLFHDLTLEYQLGKKVANVNDLPVKMTQVGSNYPLILIDENGINLVGIAPADYDNATQAFEAIDSLKAAVPALMYFNKLIFDKKPDKIIDSHQEIAEALLADLIILQNSEKLSEEDKIIGQQMLVVPLVQTLDNLDRKQIKQAQDAALEDVKDLDILDSETYHDYGRSAYDVSKEKGKHFARIAKILAKKDAKGNKEVARALSMIIGKIGRSYNEATFRKLTMLGQSEEDMKVLEKILEERYAGVDSENLQKMMDILSEEEARLSKLEYKDQKKMDDELKGSILEDVGATKEHAKEVANELYKASKPSTRKRPADSLTR